MNVEQARITTKGAAALILNRDCGVPLSDELARALDRILELAWDEGYGSGAHDTQLHGTWLAMGSWTERPVHTSNPYRNGDTS